MVRQARAHLSRPHLLRMISMAVKRSEVRAEVEEYLDADGGDDAITAANNEPEAIVKVCSAPSLTCLWHRCSLFWANGSVVLGEW